jgi:hypothetical protein
MVAFSDSKAEFTFGLLEYNICIPVVWFVLFCGVAGVGEPVKTKWWH